MVVLVRDDQGLGTLLMMEGYSQERIAQAKSTIRHQFDNAAQVIFGMVLGKTVPDTIMIDIAQNDKEELDGDTAVRMASFNSDMSRRTNQLVFSVREKTIKDIMNQVDCEGFSETVFHEMIHAADLSMLLKNNEMLDGLYKIINEEYAKSGSENDAGIALLTTLSMLEHYRSEGVAIMGSHLLLKRPFQSLPDTATPFFSIFRMTLQMAKNRISGLRYQSGIFDEGVYNMAYVVSPSILLMTLDKKEIVDKVLTEKAIEALKTGSYNDLTEDEIITIIQSSFSLSLTDYIQGLMLLGKQGSPIRDLLEFCAMLQGDWDGGNMAAFVNLVKNPDTPKLFTKTMDRIMGSAMREAEIEEYFQSFSTNPDYNSEYTQLRGKVGDLYRVLKSDADANRKRIAQWALTYLFDDEDVIHDDIVGFGLADDMTVIDYALRLLEK